MLHFMQLMPCTIGETGRRLVDRFREHRLNVLRNKVDWSAGLLAPVAQLAQRYPGGGGKARFASERFITVTPGDATHRQP